MDALNKLCKWRMILAGWHTGTKSLYAPGNQAMRDFMDKWLIARCESSATAQLLIDKGLITAEEFTAQCNKEAALLDQRLSELFPGFRTTEEGVEITNPELAAHTMRVMGFPE